MPFSRFKKKIVDFSPASYHLHLLKEHEEICNNYNSCRTQMLTWFEKILKYNPGEKSLKAPFEIYLDLECLLKKKREFRRNNNLEKSYKKS